MTNHLRYLQSSLFKKLQIKRYMLSQFRIVHSMILLFRHKRHLLYNHNISLLKKQKISYIFMKQSQEVTSDVQTKKVQIQDAPTVSEVCWERNLPDSSSRDRMIKWNFLLTSASQNALSNCHQRCIKTKGKQLTTCYM